MVWWGVCCAVHAAGSVRPALCAIGLHAPRKKVSERRKKRSLLFFPLLCNSMNNAHPLHATRLPGRALLSLGALAACYYIIWLACLVC